MAADSPPGRNARDHTLRALIESYDGRAFCRDLLADMQCAAPLPRLDATLAAELAIGVSRRRLTCEHIAATFYRGRWAGLRVPVRVILALGVYQLCWLDRIPAHAAVDQAVRQAKRHGRSVGAAVNAVLRKVSECRGSVIELSAGHDPRRCLPLEAGRGRIFTRNIFPDPDKRPLDYLIAATSHPTWLVERWHRRFKPRRCRQVCDAGMRRPRLVLRPNSTRISAEMLLARFEDAGLQGRLSEDGGSVILHSESSAERLPEIDEGLCQPQDTTAQLALRLAAPRPGDLVVDLCAGVGTKSTQAAEMMHDRGTVIATDLKTDKLEKLEQAARRLGLTIIRPTPLERLKTALAETDREPGIILVDAPCLNTGVLARRPEARYRAGQKALGSLVEIQRSLLEQAHGLAGSETRIVYSTCSLETEENEEQVAAFCEAFPEWHIERQEFTLPTHDRDGGLVAILSQRIVRTPARR